MRFEAIMVAVANIETVGQVVTPKALDWLQTLPNFLTYFGVSSLLLLGFIIAYIFITPHRELTLIKQGNVSAALAFAGALLGFALPMKAVLENAVSLTDNAVWGGVVLLVQILAFTLARLVVGWNQLSLKIAQDDRAVGLFMASVSIAVGLLNAGAVSY